MGKLRTTEEFLWKLHDYIEGIADTYISLKPRSWRDIASPEWRELRLAYEKRKRKKSFGQFISYLKQQGYVKISRKTAFPLQLTEKGKQKILEVKQKEAPLPERKDSKMIMLMYDIPKRKWPVRHAFRDAIKFLGYEMLQQSVWVTSKDVQDKTEETVRQYGLADNVNVFLIEKIKLQKP
ncbi:MAG: hypothetical protein HYU04_01505 [Candidatus Wildermuthbacteria bacterium]|nr:hypothetical protein [Candidatus Wildermuthbacteria bacterium]